MKNLNVKRIKRIFKEKQTLKTMKKQLVDISKLNYEPLVAIIYFYIDLPNKWKDNTPKKIVISKIRFTRDIDSLDIEQLSAISNAIKEIKDEYENQILTKEEYEIEMYERYS